MITTLAQFILLSELPYTQLMGQASSLRDHRALGFGFLVILLTTASLPPFAGFYAKLLLLFGLMEVQYLIFAALLILASLRSADYYLKWVQTAFFSADGLHSPLITVKHPHLISFLVTLILPTTLLLF